MVRERRVWDTANGCYWQNNLDGFFVSLEGVLLKTVSGDAGEIEAIVWASDFETRFVFEDQIGRKDRNAHPLFDGDIVTIEEKPTFLATIRWSTTRLGWVGLLQDGREVELPYGPFMELQGNVHIDQGE